MDIYPPCVYQRMAGRYTKWFCKPHNRDADHIVLNPRGRITVECAPGLGGIMIPCNCIRREMAAPDGIRHHTEN